MHAIPRRLEALAGRRSGGGAVHSGNGRSHTCPGIPQAAQLHGIHRINQAFDKQGPLGCQTQAMMFSGPPQASSSAAAQHLEVERARAVARSPVRAAHAAAQVDVQFSQRLRRHDTTRLATLGHSNQPVGDAA